MSIRAIAQELYKSQARVHALEARLEDVVGHEKETVTRELREAREELRVLRNMLEGRKAQASDTQRRFLFKR